MCLARSWVALQESVPLALTPQGLPWAPPWGQSAPSPAAWGSRFSPFFSAANWAEVDEGSACWARVWDRSEGVVLFAVRGEELLGVALIFRRVLLEPPLSAPLFALAPAPVLLAHLATHKRQASAWAAARGDMARARSTQGVEQRAQPSVRKALVGVILVLAAARAHEEAHRLEDELHVHAALLHEQDGKDDGQDHHLCQIGAHVLPRIAHHRPRPEVLVVGGRGATGGGALVASYMTILQMCRWWSEQRGLHEFRADRWAELCLSFSAPIFLLPYISRPFSLGGIAALGDKKLTAKL